MGALLAVSFLAACSEGTGIDPSDTSSTTSVVVTDESLVVMYRTVIRSVCEAETTSALDCEAPMRVSEQFSGDGTTTTETLPPIVVEAVEAELSGVTYIDPEEDFDPPFIVLGPADMPLPDVVAIKAGSICGELCGAGTIYYFQYDGSAWQAVTADELGFDTEIWMS